MDAQQLDAALQAEYLHVQKTIEDFDGRALTIKAWSVSFGLVSLVGAFATRISAVFLLAVVSSALFWLLESFWKSFQLGYYERVEAIEAHFRKEKMLTSPHQISSTWQAWWEKTSWWVLARTAIWVHVALPHALVLIVGILAYLLLPQPSVQK